MDNERRPFVTAGDVVAVAGLVVAVVGLWLLDWRLGMAFLGVFVMMMGIERVRRGG